MLQIVKRPRKSVLLYLILIMSITLTFAQNNTELLTLDDCINIALENNSILINTEYAYTAAKKDVVGSYEGVLPRIDVSAGKGRVETGPSEYLSNEPVGIDPETGNVIYEQRTRKIDKQFRESSSASVTVSQTFFDGGIWWNQIRKARADKRSAEYEYETQKNQVVLDVQEAYFDLLKQIKLLEVNQLAVDRSKAQLDRAERMFELGATAKLDVYRARVNLGNDRITLLTQKNVVAQARQYLNLVMGRKPETPIKIDAPLDLKSALPSIDGLIHKSFENQPMIKKNEADIKSRELSLAMAKGINFPRISAYVNYDRFHENTHKVFSDFDQNYQTRYGINLSFNLFNGFSDIVNVQKAAISEKSARETFENYRRQLAASIRQYYANYQSYLDIIEINEQNLEAAKEEYRLADERYQIGAGTALEVREAQVNLTRAEQTLVAARYNARIVLAQLDNQVGISLENIE